MHQVFAIFLRDVKRILKNPVALVVTLGVAIIPSLYAWCNILANWDPYANTGNIQVAVANEDKGTTSTLVGHLAAGGGAGGGVPQHDHGEIVLEHGLADVQNVDVVLGQQGTHSGGDAHPVLADNGNNGFHNGMFLSVYKIMI